MTIKVQILQCLQFLEVDNSSDLAIVQEQNKPVYRYVMAKLETTLPHSSIPETAYLKSVAIKILPLGYRSWIAYFFAVPRRSF
jgi:hypothetical protein